MPEAGGVTVKDVSSHDFVIAYAAHLKRIGKIEVPKWADLVKTSVHKELAPYDPDWYYIRAAAIARRVYLRNGIGVGAFKRIFGGRRMRGTIPERFQSSSGSIARHILKEVRCSPSPSDSAGGEGPVPRDERPGRHYRRARGHAPHAPGGSILACCPTSTPCGSNSCSNVSGETGALVGFVRPALICTCLHAAAHHPWHHPDRWRLPTPLSVLAAREAEDCGEGAGLEGPPHHAAGAA